MSAILAPPPRTLAELIHQLGDVRPERILADPPPGTATPADVLRLCNAEPRRLCELVDGVLVEKPRGHQESRLAYWLGVYVGEYLRRNDRGIATGADGPHELEIDLIRFPDFAFIAYDRIPPGADPATPMPDWVPNLVAEVLSPGNTAVEMDRKLREYFDAGVQLVWYIDPRSRTVRVYSSHDDFTTLTEGDELDGGSVLPGFRLSIRELFELALKLHP
jgi:Uma2 family endonuclease